MSRLCRILANDGDVWRRYVRARHRALGFGAASARATVVVRTARILVDDLKADCAILASAFVHVAPLLDLVDELAMMPLLRAIDRAEDTSPALGAALVAGVRMRLLAAVTPHLASGEAHADLPRVVGAPATPPPAADVQRLLHRAVVEEKDDVDAVWLLGCIAAVVAPHAGLVDAVRDDGLVERTRLLRSRAAATRTQIIAALRAAVLWAQGIAAAQAMLAGSAEPRPLAAALHEAEAAAVHWQQTLIAHAIDDCHQVVLCETDTTAWDDTHVYMQDKSCTEALLQWNLHLRALVHDLFPVSPDACMHVTSAVLAHTVALLLGRYTVVRPSRTRLPQFVHDIGAIVAIARSMRSLVTDETMSHVDTMLIQLGSLLALVACPMAHQIQLVDDVAAGRVVLSDAAPALLACEAWKWPPVDPRALARVPLFHPADQTRAVGSRSDVAPSDTRDAVVGACENDFRALASGGVFALPPDVVALVAGNHPWHAERVWPALEPQQEAERAAAVDAIKRLRSALPG